MIYHRRGLWWRCCSAQAQSVFIFSMMKQATEDTTHASSVLRRDSTKPAMSPLMLYVILHIERSDDTSDISQRQHKLQQRSDLNSSVEAWTVFYSPGRGLWSWNHLQEREYRQLRPYSWQKSQLI